MLAERAGLRIHEVPVDWVDDPDSRVDIWRTARDDVRGIARLGWALLRGTMPLAEVSRAARTARPPPGADGSVGTQVALFAVIGVFSTVAYAVLYLLLRGVLSPFWANAHRPGARRRSRTPRPTGGSPSASAAAATPCATRSQGLAIFAVGLGVTTGSLWLLHADHARPGRVHRDGRAHPGEPVRHRDAVRRHAAVGLRPPLTPHADLAHLVAPHPLTWRIWLSRSNQMRQVSV